MVKNTLTDTVENETRADGGRHLNQLFSDLAQVTSREVGRAWVFALALGTVVVWALTGPFFEFSDTWQPRYQYRDYHRDVSNGVFDTKLTKQGCRCHPNKAQRTHSGQQGA